MTWVEQDSMMDLARELLIVLPEFDTQSLKVIECAATLVILKLKQENEHA